MVIVVCGALLVAGIAIAVRLSGTTTPPRAEGLDDSLATHAPARRAPLRCCDRRRRRRRCARRRSWWPVDHAAARRHRGPGRPGGVDRSGSAGRPDLLTAPSDSSCSEESSSVSRPASSTSPFGGGCRLGEVERSRSAACCSSCSPRASSPYGRATKTSTSLALVGCRS